MEADTLNDPYDVIMWFKDVGILEKVTCHDEEMKVMKNTKRADGFHTAYLSNCFPLFYE